MNTIADSSIAFLAAFECGPMVAYLLHHTDDAELRKMYRAFVVQRIEVACNHLDAIPADLCEGIHLERLSTLSYHVTAADVDSSREKEHLQAAMMLLEEILKERGDR